MYFYMLSKNNYLDEPIPNKNSENLRRMTWCEHTQTFDLWCERFSLMHNRQSVCERNTHFKLSFSDLI